MMPTGQDPSTSTSSIPVMVTLMPALLKGKQPNKKLRDAYGVFAPSYTLQKWCRANLYPANA